MNMAKENTDNHALIQWNDDHTIVTVTLMGTNRADIDRYIETNLEILRNWEKGETTYLIQNVSGEAVSFTPYLKGRLGEIENLMKTEQLRVFAAIIVGNNLTGHVIQAFGRLFMSNLKDVHQRFFMNMADAHTWLEKEQQNQTK